MVYAQSRIRPRKWGAKNFLGFWGTNEKPNLGRTTRSSENLPDGGLCCSSWPQRKTERNWKRDQYPDRVRELKKLWNMRVMMISILMCVLATVTKGLVPELKDLEIRGQVEISVEISQNSDRHPGDLRRRTVTQTSVENNQLTMVCKTLKKIRY